MLYVPLTLLRCGLKATHCIWAYISDSIETTITYNSQFNRVEHATCMCTCVMCTAFAHVAARKQVSTIAFISEWPRCLVYWITGPHCLLHTQCPPGHEFWKRGRVFAYSCKFPSLVWLPCWPQARPICLVLVAQASHIWSQVFAVVTVASLANHIKICPTNPLTRTASSTYYIHVLVLQYAYMHSHVVYDECARVCQSERVCMWECVYIPVPREGEYRCSLPTGCYVV